jgi:RNAse (barnase) inhibitor barstar
MVRKVKFYINFLEKEKRFVDIFEEFEMINSNKSSFLIDGNHCQSTEDLFTYCSREFLFPEYFGKNWSAFSDCISNLDDTFEDIALFHIVILAPDLILGKEEEKWKEIFWKIICCLDKLKPKENIQQEKEICINFFIYTQNNKFDFIKKIFDRYDVQFDILHS